MNWTYKGHVVRELPEEVVGFVYCIYYTNGKKYIGKKTVKSMRKVKPLKGMRKNAVRRVEKESDWRTYDGSSEFTKELTIHSKVITHLCTNKMSTTYLEERELMKVDAPANDEYINKTIGRRYYDNCLDGVYEGDINTRNLFTEEM